MESKQTRGPIVLACDKRYAMPLATTLRSIVETDRSGEPLEFHVLADGLSERIRRRILDSLPHGSASIRWIEVDLGMFQEFSTISYISKITYARFLIPRIFPDTVSKVLYLDCDLLALDDLQALWATDLEGNVLGAVLDRLDSQIKNQTVRLPVPRVRDYFNAGVLLIDLHQWRKAQIVETALDYLKRCPGSPYSDQDALNVACDGFWKKLDSRWNYLAYNEKLDVSELAGEHKPSIVHFTTWNKPWRPGVPNANAALYDSFRSRTRFPRNSMDRMEATLRIGWSHIKGFQKARQDKSARSDAMVDRQADQSSFK
ncbi:glycosyltransferase family 8 protein [Bradyrhizobium sp. Leo121]|uniref:glycosyltransferase family 8 protein n=1 Tax=Bradyrhizobium sp. Leo121 TaxID=1571195 RepID=UPI001028A77A|nr:glycosyltransferase family 8 protein [Bradyrhizobium sp. Leo121]RZN33405.1 glycosyltransferase family 8 protein [Bradyrhizobium sp. Leo121]